MRCSWAHDAEVDTHCFADLCLKWIMLGQGAQVPIKHQILGLLVQKLVIALGQFASGSKTFFSVDLALHNVKLTIDRQQAFFRLNQNHALHAI